jgi:hypothetical protein
LKVKDICALTEGSLRIVHHTTTLPAMQLPASSAVRLVALLTFTEHVSGLSFAEPSLPPFNPTAMQGISPSSAAVRLGAFLTITAAFGRGVGGSFTRDLFIQPTGDDCAYTAAHDIWEYRGDTLDGRPYYWNEICGILTAFTQHDFYLYYDANCDGKSGAEHSVHGHPQWVIQAKLPDTKAAFNTDRDGKCFGDTDYAGGYSKDPTYDMVPTGGGE